eukprot:scaffold409220_cov31-Prasinocladus_malaysianus.AAC.1
MHTYARPAGDRSLRWRGVRSIYIPRASKSETHAYRTARSSIETCNAPSTGRLVLPNYNLLTVVAH